MEVNLGHKERYTLFISILVLLLVTISVMSSFWTIWTEYPSNPVFDPASGVRAYYPTVQYDVSRFSGHGTNAAYKMWFANGSGIAYAYSDDGYNWTEYNNSTALSGLSGSPNHPVVLYDSAGFGGGSYYYKMWYWDTSVGYNTFCIRYAESTDGINWVNDQALQQHPTDNSLQPITGVTTVYDAWFYHCYGPGSVLYNPGASNTGSGTPDDRSDDQPMTYRYVMYYDTSSEGTSSVGTYEDTSLCYSTDGIYWIRYSDTPVLYRTANAADWDGFYSYRASVHNIAGTYHMWYSGSNGDNSIGTYYAHGVGHASSPDGLNWTPDADNPVFHVTDGVSWRDVRSYTPAVLYDSSSFSGNGDAAQYKIWFTGRTGSNYTLGYAYIPGANQPPNACFSFTPRQGIYPLTVTFNAACSTDTDGTITGWVWDFGDGSSASGSVVTHTFTYEGNYNVRLTVTDNSGDSDSTTDTVIVNPPLQACFTVNTDYGFAPLEVTFSAECSEHYQNLGITSYEWSVNGEILGIDTPFTYSFTEEGVYTVLLTVTDSDGNISTISRDITVRVAHPPVGITLERIISRSYTQARAFHILRWGNNPKNADLDISNYKIYRKLSSEPYSAYKIIGEVSGSVHSYTDESLPVNEVYTYIIRTSLKNGHDGTDSEEIASDNSLN